MNGGRLFGLRSRSFVEGRFGYFAISGFLWRFEYRASVDCTWILVSNFVGDRGMMVDSICIKELL
jgi:hypothetical protein